LGALIADGITVLLPDLIAGASQELTVAIHAKDAGIDEISGFVKVWSFDESNFVFVNESSAATVLSFLRILEACLESDCGQFGEPILDLCARLISLPFHVSPLKQQCWAIVEIIARSANVF
jgi:hypothetical protein